MVIVGSADGAADAGDAAAGVGASRGCCARAVPPASAHKHVSSAQADNHPLRVPTNDCPKAPTHSHFVSTRYPLHATQRMPSVNAHPSQLRDTYISTSYRQSRNNDRVEIEKTAVFSNS
jgi:hypothetical protein